jgi:hypothetical protein
VTPVRIKVVSVRTSAPYKLTVQFNDGTFGIFDCAGLIGERGEGTEALRDRAYFGKVILENGVPTWPNHFDLSPEWLQTEMINRGELRRPLPVRGRPASAL